jgi:parvulin-like peptidyl-prolyl isomerase
VTVALRNKILLATLLGFCAGIWAQANYPGTAVRVNGADISYQRFIGFYEEYQRSKGVAIGARGDQLPLLTRLRREAMDQVVEQELVAQAAEAQGVEVDEADVDAAIAELREPFEVPEQFISRLETEGFTEEEYRVHVRRMMAAKHYLDEIRSSVAEVSDEELEKYYRDNEIRLTLPEQVRVRHILLTWKPLGTRDDRAALREQMTAILEQARSGSDFAELARIHSEDSTAQDGGDTDFFHRGQMVPAFEEAAFSLQPGEVSDIVETPFGLHILRLEERKEPRLLPLDEIRDQLRDHVSKEKQEQAVEQEIARLRGAAEIQVLIAVERPGGG